MQQRMPQVIEFVQYKLMEERHTEHWPSLVAQSQYTALHKVVVFFPGKKDNSLRYFLDM